MKLNTLLQEIEYVGSVQDSEVEYITDNSGRVKPGCVFVCIKGNHFDGHDVAVEMQSKGAVAVVTERDLGLKNQILVKNTRAAYTRLCSALFGYPERKLKIVGITGTNGKTTSAFVLKSAFDQMNIKCSLLGTVKNIVGNGIEYDASLTTPDPYDLFSLFSQMVENGCEYCVMEVSSQALDQHRVEGIRFVASIFTNLTRDHLDYHGTFEKYQAAKHILFENSDIAVLNSDDEAFEYMMEGTSCRNVTFSVYGNDSDYSAKNIRSSASGVKYELVCNDNIGRVNFAVPGNFSVYNSMGAAVCLIELGMNFNTVVDSMSECKGVPGRMEVVPTDTPFTVIIDYAHTPDGLENVLKSVKEFAEGKVIAVYGCGGDRDRTKRPIMGSIGVRLADTVIITSDNPRTEDPQTIIDEILAGIEKHMSKVIVEIDRTSAIRKAIEIAKPDDVIVLAGKGHETYQILSTGKIHYDERDIVAQILNNK